MRPAKLDDFAEEEEEFRRALDAIPPPTPPDGGWGWVIVFSSFFINMIVDGVCYSYGILMPELLEAFDSSTALISMGGALLLGTYMMSGAFASALCNRFGSRRIALSGCLISSMSLLFSQLAEHGAIFVVLFGLCGGVGFGLMFLASLVVIGFYFERNRGIAATIAMCGSSIGMAVLAPFTRWLLQRYSWESTVVMLSGVVLNGFVLASLLRPIDADLLRRKKMILKRMEEDKRIGVQTCIILQRLIEQKKQDRTMSSGSLNNGIITRDNEVIREKDLHKHRILNGIRAAFSRSSVNLAGQTSWIGTPALPSKHQHAPAILVNDASPNVSTENSPMLHRSRSASPNNLRKQVLISQSSQLRKNTSAKSLIVLSSQIGLLPNPEKEFSSAQELAQGAEDAQSLQSMHITPSASTEYLFRRFLHAIPDVDRPMYRKDIYYTGSVQILPHYHTDVDDYIASITEIPRRETLGRGDFWSRLPWLPKSIRDVLRTVFDTETFKSPTYILLLISTSLTMLGYYVPFLLLPLFAVKVSGGEGNDEMSAACLLTILGVSNTIGRVLSGILGSRRLMDSLVINNLALLIAGVITILVPHVQSYFLLSLFAVIFGMCVAAFSSLRSVIVVELMGLDKLTTCFSQLVVFHGLAVLLGTPFAGFLHDYSGKYNLPFYFAGGAMLLSGCISIPLRRVAQYESRRNGHLESPSSSMDDDLKKDTFIKPQELVGL